jgi:hypothetical protein
MPILNERTIKEALADNEFELPIGFTDKDGNFQRYLKNDRIRG